MDCPHLVQSYEAFFVDDAVSIIMEFLDCSLHQLLASLPNCRLPPPALQWTLFQVWGTRGGGGTGISRSAGWAPFYFFSFSRFMVYHMTCSWTSNQRCCNLQSKPLLPTATGTIALCELR